MKFNKLAKLSTIAATAVLASGCANTVDIKPYYGDESKPILIYDYLQTTINSAGGVNVRMTAFNNSGKQIKYFDFWMSHKNKVGDLEANRINGKLQQAYRLIGPFDYSATMFGNFGPSFYSNAAHCAVLDKIEITYMDNTKRTLTFEKLKGTFLFNSEECRNLWSKRY